jgi:hypothetical protein
MLEFWYWQERISFDFRSVTQFVSDGMGYGFFVGARHRFGHVGGNVGYQATMVMFADAGNGAVIMTNSDIALHVGNAVLDAIARVYGWNYIAAPPP